MTVTRNRKFYTHFAVQGMIAIVFLYFVLYFLDYVGAQSLIWAAGASSLASTTFIVFGTPHINSAKPHRIFIGYLIALFCGHFIRLLSNYYCNYMAFCQNPEYIMQLYEFAAVVSLALTFFLMVILRSAHPPAAGLSIVMVIDITNIEAMVVIGLSALILSMVMLFFKNRLMPLI